MCVWGGGSHGLTVTLKGRKFREGLSPGPICGAGIDGAGEGAVHGAGLAFMEVLLCSFLSGDCDPPEKPAHGYFQGANFTSGSMVTYHCESR